MRFDRWSLAILILAAGAHGCSESGTSSRAVVQPVSTPEPSKEATGDNAAPPDSPAEAESPAAPADAKTDEEPAASASTTAVALAPRADQAPVAVTFEDLNLNMQADIVYRPVMMTDRVRELEGKRIKLKGFMLPDARVRKIKEFVLVKNTECKFGPGGQADHLAEIKMQGDATATHTNRPVEVEGVLRIEPFQGTDGNTWSIFQIEATSVRPG